MDNSFYCVQKTTNNCFVLSCFLGQQLTGLNGWQISLCSANDKNVFTFFSQQLTGFHFVQQTDDSFHCVQLTADTLPVSAAITYNLSLCSANSWQVFTPCSKWLTAFTVFSKQVFTFVFKPTADEFSVCAAVSNKLSLCSEKNKTKKTDKVSLCAANRKHVFTVCSRCLTRFLFEQQVLTSFTLCSKQLTSFHCVQQIVPQVPTIWYTKQNKTHGTPPKSLLTSTPAQKKQRLFRIKGVEWRASNSSAP